MRPAFAAALAAGIAGAAWAAAPDGIVGYTIADAREIPEPLGGLAGDAERGRALYFERERVRCFTCHGSPGGPGVEGNAAGLEAPPLTDLGARMSAGEARLWIVAPQVLAEDGATGMPAYYSLGGRTDPDDPLYGGPVLTAQEVEDILAWLLPDPLPTPVEGAE